MRGGGDLGQYWHLDGKLGNKPNTFKDTIAAATHLIQVWSSLPLIHSVCSSNMSPPKKHPPCKRLHIKPTSTTLAFCWYNVCAIDPEAQASHMKILRP